MLTATSAATFTQTLIYMGIGMLGIFLVTLAIIGSIALLNGVTNAADKRKRSGAEDD